MHMGLQTRTHSPKSPKRLRHLTRCRELRAACAAADRQGLVAARGCPTIYILDGGTAQGLICLTWNTRCDKSPWSPAARQRPVVSCQLVVRKGNAITLAI